MLDAGTCYDSDPHFIKICLNAFLGTQTGLVCKGALTQHSRLVDILYDLFV